MEAPEPKPRTKLIPPVPLPRTNSLRGAVRLRKKPINYRTSVIERNRCLEVLNENETGCQQPCHNIPSTSNNPLSQYWAQMSARAIASAKSRADRPLSAYDETSETVLNRRRASVAVMPLAELELRDRAVETMALQMQSTDLCDNPSSSPEFGAIRVQVEDITTVPDSMDDERVQNSQSGSFDSEELGDTSSETICEQKHNRFTTKTEQAQRLIGQVNPSVVEENRQDMTVADWAVPCEYASSPIAVELTESMADERPPPPILPNYLSKQGSSSIKSSNDSETDGDYSDFVAKRNAFSTSTTTIGVTLLEKIIRSSKIWFLPHIGRPEVLQLLRKKEAGNFIVRSSTRTNCMALSVRLPECADVETDHYIIEKLSVPMPPPLMTTKNLVRLEGSPITFTSLPLLVEHYCLNGEELEVKLQLPLAVRSCKTTRQLQSIALLEKDFWTSDMSLSRRVTRTSSKMSVVPPPARMCNNNKNNNNTIPRCHGNSIKRHNNDDETSTWFMDSEKSVYDEIDKLTNVDYCCSSLDTSPYYTAHERILGDNHSGISSGSSGHSLQNGFMTAGMTEGEGKTKSKRRSTSRSSRASTSSSRFATVCVSEIPYADNQNTSINGEDETDSCLSFSNSPSNKYEKAQESGLFRTERRSQSVRSHKSEKGGCQLSSTSGSQTISRSRPRSFLKSLLSFGSSSLLKDSKKKGERNELASCEYFKPWDQPSEVKISRSAFDIATAPQKGFFSNNKKKNQNSYSNNTNQRKPSFRSNIDIFDDENYTRGWKDIANEEITALSGSPGGAANSIETMKTFKPKEEVGSRSRPVPMRRERADIIGAPLGLIKNNAQRLAYHNESSPGPGVSRIPMTPPTNANDPQIVKNCVEELRRKRLQSANEMLMTNQEYVNNNNINNNFNNNHVESRSAHASPKVSMRCRTNGWSSPSTSGFNKNGFAAIDRNRNGEHRLSVPNLVVASEPVVPGSVGHSAKALRERMGRNNDGELMVINEGLVTPVVRRKNFSTTPKVVDIGKTSSSNEKEAESESVAATGGEVAKRKEALEALIIKRKNRQLSETNSSSGSDQDQSSLGSKSSDSLKPSESELIWRRVKHQKPATPSWSAINYELKSRQQKIAKVRPTPHLRNRDMTIGGASSENMSSRRSSSDYAQLCDFASSSMETPRGAHLEAHSKVDDDAVSVAGTVFNEPWDSNVWENLLDLAHHGDENPIGLKVSDTIQEEDSDSDRTADGSTSHMESDDEEEELCWPKDDKNESRRTLPSDRVVVKAWEHEDDEELIGSAKFNTLDSRGKLPSIGGGGGTLKRNPAGSFSMRSLPRALSRFSNGMTGAASFGSIDDLPTTLPSMSPLLSGRVSRGANPIGTVEREKNEKIGRAVQEYVEKLAQVREGSNACFGLTLRQFVACTKETKETDPSVVVRNVRQFINGMKNYLVKHGEGDLHRIIDEESARLNSNQILNIDAVLEAVLHKLLLREVKPLLYHVMIREHSKSGALQLISSNIGVVRKMSLTELGFSNADKLTTPTQQTMEAIKVLMRKMQSHYSPLKKLENLMKSVSMVVACQNPQLINEENTDPALQRGIPAADDLVRWMVYILARTSTVGCEVEAWYMWELLPQPILMQSDASYYLTALFSAVHVLKSSEAIRRLCENDDKIITAIDMNRHCSSPMLSTGTITRGHSPKVMTMPTATCDAFVKIAVPDETVGCVRYTTFPGVPMLTTSKLSRLVAHQQGITNPEEHGLYLISDGFESCLQPADCPAMIHEQLKKENKPHLFAYKRHEAKIAWPRSAISAC